MLDKKELGDIDPIVVWGTPSRRTVGSCTPIKFSGALFQIPLPASVCRRRSWLWPGLLSRTLFKPSLTVILTWPLPRPRASSTWCTTILNYFPSMAGFTHLVDSTPPSDQTRRGPQGQPAFIPRSEGAMRVEHCGITVPTTREASRRSSSNCSAKPFPTGKSLAIAIAIADDVFIAGPLHELSLRLPPR